MQHGKLAESRGMLKENILIGQNGIVFEFGKTWQICGSSKGENISDGLGVVM